MKRRKRLLKKLRRAAENSLARQHRGDTGRDLVPGRGQKFGQKGGHTYVCGGARLAPADDTRQPSRQRLHLRRHLPGPRGRRGDHRPCRQCRVYEPAPSRRSARRSLQAQSPRWSAIAPGGIKQEVNSSCPTTSFCCHSNPTLPSSTQWRTSGNTFAAISSPLVFGTVTRQSSRHAQRPGTSSRQRSRPHPLYRHQGLGNSQSLGPLVLILKILRQIIIKITGHLPQLGGILTSRRRSIRHLNQA